MLKLKLGELYGFDSIEELMEAIDNMQSMGMSEEELNKMLERSEQGKKESDKELKKEILLDNLCRLRSDIRLYGIRVRNNQVQENYIKALDEVIEIIDNKIPEEKYKMILSSDKTAMANSISYTIKNGTPFKAGYIRKIIETEEEA